MENKLKTFSDSYIFNYDKNNSGKSIAKEINKKLIEYIMTAERLENKRIDALSGIREEVKRQQTSSLLYSVLMRDDVVLCINTVELPRAFKCFEATDIKEGRNKKKVFIDVTGIFKFNNGYYSCNNIFTFITYLSEAVTYLLYRNDTIKFLNNSNITSLATECYIRCFTYILDYLRMIGYSANRKKIEYLTGLFFLNNIMGKELNSYSKNLSAKICGIAPNEMKAYELYFNPEDFTNIDTYINMIVNNFKLDQLTTEVFISKWMYHFGKGTEYAIDLFTSFVNMVMSAYRGAYIVNQKQIEKCCGKAMVKLSASVMELGANNLDMPVMEDGELNVHSRETEALREAFKMKSSLPEYAKINKVDFGSKDVVKTKIKNLVKFYIVSKQEAKISTKLTNIARSAMNNMDKIKVTENYEVGVLECIISEGKKFFSDKDKRNLIGDIDTMIGALTDNMKKDKIRVNKDLCKKIALELTELRKCQGKIV